MKFTLSLLLILTFLPVTAQKHSEQVIEAKNIEKIFFSSDEIYSVRIKTVEGEQIRILSDAEGEYFNNISLDHEIMNKTLYLSSRYREILQSGYDKLSAHKVFSMEVIVEMPSEMTVEIKSNLASVYVTGSYKNVLVQLNSGSCFFSNFTGDAVVNTYAGNISGSVFPAEYEVNSRHGQVSVPKNTFGTHKMVLTSINGDIKLSETK